MKTSLLLTLQYRLDFVLEAVLSIFWVGATLLPVVVIFETRQSIGGWTFAETLLVVGWFTILNAILDGVINPSLLGIVEHIRKGTLDFVLLKPADAQFLVSTQRFLWMELCYGISGLGIIAYALHRMHRTPSLMAIAASLMLTMASVVLLYSVWIMIASAAFYIVKIDNLNYLIKSIFDAGRWPITIFKGMWRLLLTWIVPIGLMTTFPVQALLGNLRMGQWVGALIASVVISCLARLVWKRSLKNYTSASS